MQFLRNLVRRCFLNYGFFVSRVVDRQRIEEFFGLIRSHQAHSDLVRVGGMGDGGYLIPDDLTGIAECFSPGVSVVADFEKDLVARGMQCYLVDYSVTKSPFQHEMIDFEKKYLGVTDDEIFCRLDTWVASKQKTSADLILQMDIEGAEYRVLLDASDEVLSKFRIIVIEFHHLNQILDLFGFEMIDLVFRKLLKHFLIVHIHPNNCRQPVEYCEYAIPPVMEFTFLRKDRIANSGKSGVSPHPLDVPCLEGVTDVPLPVCWRG